LITVSCVRETVKVTGIVCGVLEAVGDETTADPEYVPALRPVVLTETLTLPGVLPEPVAVNHVPPDVLTVKLSAAPVLPTDSI